LIHSPGQVLATYRSLAIFLENIHTLDNCLVISPAFPTSMNGVQDFASLLASALSLKTSVKFHFLSLPSLSENAISSLVKPYAFIHLHYVGYGYSKYGTPVNLVCALEKWKQNCRNQLLITFHELFAESLIPWKKSFYLQKYQKLLFYKLSKIADFAVVSCHAFEPHFPSPVSKFPVFSNIPVPPFLFPFEMRNDYAVIWGNLEAKRSAYSFLGKYNQTVSKNWKWTKIMDIGVLDPVPPSLPVPIIHLGFLKANEISCLLSSCKYAVLTTYSPDYFSKSGIFAAYASHGLAVLSAPLKQDYFASLDGLSESIHFQKINKEVYQFPSFLASKLNTWYGEHDLEKHVKLIYLPIIRKIVQNYFCY
jgi:hypothetical protein